MMRMTTTFFVVGLGVVAGMSQQAACAEPAAPAMVRVANLIGPRAKIDATLGLWDEKTQTAKSKVKLKQAAYPSLGDYVAFEKGGDYELDIDVLLDPGRGGGDFGSQQHLKLVPGRQYTLVLWGSGNVRVIDEAALFPFANKRMANVILLAALDKPMQFVFGSDRAGSVQFAFGLKPGSIESGAGDRPHVLTTFQATAGKVPLQVLNAKGDVVSGGDLTLEAAKAHYVVVVGDHDAPEVVIMADGATKRLGK